MAQPAISGTNPATNTGNAHRFPFRARTPEGEPGRKQQGGDDARIAGGGPVEVGEEDQQARQCHPGPRRLLRHPEESEQASRAKGHAPGQVLGVHDGLRSQEDQDRARQDRGEKGPVRGSLRPSERRISSEDDANPPEEQARKNGGDQPRRHDRHRSQAAVERVGHQQDRDADERGKHPEVGVRPPVADECFETDASRRKREMAVQHGSSLDVVDRSGSIDSEWVDGSAPKIPCHPEIRQRYGQYCDEHDDLKSADSASR